MEQVKSDVPNTVGGKSDPDAGLTVEDAARNALLLCQWLRDKANEGIGFRKQELLDSADACEANIRAALGETA